MKKLSAYTVASNCTDLTDIRDGIAEIHEAMKTCVESGKHIPSFYVSRLAKLETKKKKLEKRTQVHMTKETEVPSLSSVPVCNTTKYTIHSVR